MQGELPDSPRPTSALSETLYAGEYGNCRWRYHIGRVAQWQGV